jgi:hypothetical protein
MVGILLVTQSGNEASTYMHSGKLTMSAPKLRAVLLADAGSSARAFETPFNIPRTSHVDDYGVSTSDEHGPTGCRVPRVSLSIHCSQAHLECASHVLPNECPSTVSAALSNGMSEICILVTPRIERLGESGESYPVGDPTDLVISARSVRAALSLVDLQPPTDSILLRVPDEFLPRISGSNEIQSWPYLTLECAQLIHDTFGHYRTNAPSVERLESHGGMWSHCIIFGIEHDTRCIGPEGFPRRTIGELFHVPDHVIDGLYRLVCPFVDLGLDCAITVPLLYEFS